MKNPWDEWYLYNFDKLWRLHDAHHFINTVLFCDSLIDRKQALTFILFAIKSHYTFYYSSSVATVFYPQVSSEDTLLVW